jgi:hypothetical protein
MARISRACGAMMLCLAICLPVISRAQDNREAVSLIDQRPDNEKIRKWVSGSGNITSCNYGIMIMDDRDQVESRISSLRKELNSKIGDRLAGKEVILKQYLVSWNMGALGRGATYGGSSPVAGGIVGSVMSGMGADCPPAKVPIGWYAKSEAENSKTPFISIISLEVDGKVYTERLVTTTGFEYPLSGPPFGGYLRMQKEYWSKGVALTIERANSSFAKQLASALP